MNILFTLCGRAGSKGFKNKNLKIFEGIPLIYYGLASIKAYLEEYHKADDKIVVCVNTDSEELIELVNRQSVIVVEVIRREENLGGDAVPKVDVIRNCLHEMENRTGDSYDVVVDLDITSPLRTAEDIHNAIEKKLSRDDTDVVYSVTDARRNPYFNIVKKEDGFFSKAFASEYTARQQAPVFYDMNASIYVYSIDALNNKQSNVFFNDCCDAIFMKDTGILDINSEEDFELLQVIAHYLFERDDAFKQLYEIAKEIH